MINYIVNKLSTEDLLLQLSEEAAELAKAASKYHRILRGTNPSPVSLADARNALIEEMADVNVAAEAIRIELSIYCEEIAEVEDIKIERWRKRVCDADKKGSDSDV